MPKSPKKAEKAAKRSRSRRRSARLAGGERTCPWADGSSGVEELGWGVSRGPLSKAAPTSTIDIVDPQHENDMQFRWFPEASRAEVAFVKQYPKRAFFSEGLRFRNVVQVHEMIVAPPPKEEFFLFLKGTLSCLCARMSSLLFQSHLQGDRCIIRTTLEASKHSL